MRTRNTRLYNKDKKKREKKYVPHKNSERELPKYRSHHDHPEQLARRERGKNNYKRSTPREITHPEPETTRHRTSPCWTSIIEVPPPIRRGTKGYQGFYL
jgi:hypothetical protein